jgi:DNA helicase-2/ATP-dependent DNA helicase PcrA
MTATLSLTPARLADALGLPPPTAEQAAVITAPAQPALVVAGAGAGKTETMAARVVWLVATGAVLPEQVLGLTFTRKAAQQLTDRIRARLRRLVGTSLLDELDPSGERRAAVQAGDVTVATYHAYAGRLVSEHALRLPAEPGARLLSETAGWQLAHRVVSTWATDLDTDKVPATMTGYLLALAGELGEHLVEPDQLAEHAHALISLIENAPPGPRQRGPMTAEVRKVLDAQRMRVELLPLLAAFTARKRAERVHDFADQMSIAARIAERHPEVGAGERERYRAVLLDEYQDTGHAQRVLLRSLFRTGPGEPALALTAVGDPCQSIYGWRGASAANLPRFETDFPRQDGGRWLPARQFGLLTSFRNPPEVLTLANVVSEPLRMRGVRVGELGPRPGAPAGTVRVALHPDVTAELDWVADALADRWHARVDAGQDPPTAAVLTRRRADMAPMAAALRARGLPVEVVGLGGLLAEPEVRDLVSALRLVADPLAGTAAVRLLTGARWRLGVADLAALWRRAKELARPLSGTGPAADTGALLAGALPGEQAEQAGLVDALDDPGDRANYSAAGFRRISRLSKELDHLRGRAGGAGTSGWAGLPDLVADTERALLLDAETAARPGPVGRVHLDAFADVVADFAAGAEVPTLSALLDYLAAAEDAEDGLSPGEVEVATDRVQILTVHAAKGLEWELVAVPNLVERVFPGQRRTGTWLSNPAELPVVLRGDAPDLPVPEFPPDGNRKELEEAFKAHTADLEERRLEEERRLFYVAITRAEHSLFLSGHWWGTTDRMRGPSPFLTEVAEVGPAAVVVEHWAEQPGDDEPNPVTATPRTGHWPIDPLGPRRAEVARGADLVREELRRLRRADPEAPDPTQLSLFESGGNGSAGPDGPGPAGTEPEPDDPDNWVADVDALLAERAAAREARTEVALPAALSVSQLVEMAADPDALAARLRRPMPFPPNPHARRGTAFHAWLEQRFGATRLLDLDELPGAADEGAAGDDTLEALRAAFLASAWAERRPIEVEVPFETVVFDGGAEDSAERAGIAVRGRMDAVFADPDGGVTVVDWKTGALPDESKLPELSVQLAAYRLAWAALSGTDVHKVRAAFHYVRQDVTLRPADLLDADGLRALLRSVPSAGG